MLAWPCALVARRLARGFAARVVIGGWALAAWDLFLDPQMVAAGHWVWASGAAPGLPGIPSIPWTNYAGWLAVALVMAAVLRAVPGARKASDLDAPMVAFYLWTYASSVLAHAAFWGLPASAAWGALGMGLVAVPLALSLPLRPLIRVEAR
jgi:putative membrane protein